MNIGIISFTEQGNQKNKELVKHLSELGVTCSGYLLERFYNSEYEEAGLFVINTSLNEWTGEQFEQADGIIFIGAMGIAVRGIAPFIKDKMLDPAVVVMDEKGQYAISVLSGHVGGGNQLAHTVAQVTGAIPVITTATDVNGVFAVDMFAKEQGLLLSDRQMAKEISAALLEGQTVGFHSDFPIEGTIPDGLMPQTICEKNLWITYRHHMEPGQEYKVLSLIPKVLILGIGCRKGTKKQAIKALVEQVMEEENLSLQAVSVIASIDLKKEEPGLVEFAKELDVEFHTYCAEELKQARGSYTEHDFVSEITGVGNVCERAAAWEAQMDDSCLLVRKRNLNGVTVAVAKKNWKVVL